MKEFELKPPSRKVTLSRLKKARKFWGTLREEQFDFSEFVLEAKEVKSKMCGSVCCLLGWMPAVNKKYFQWDYYGDDAHVYLSIGGIDKNGRHIDGRDVIYYFGLKDDLYGHLFEPYGQNTFVFGGRYLNEESKLTEVLSNVDEVIKRLESGEFNTYLDEYLVIR